MTQEYRRVTAFAPSSTEDQWSEIKPVLQSTKYQQLLACYAKRWMEEEQLSRDGLLDDVIVELCVQNQADLFDYNRLYIDLEQRSIIDDLPEDTRHAIGRLLAKAERCPQQRLHAALVDLYMWIDLAMKCREARRKLEQSAQ